MKVHEWSDLKYILIDATWPLWIVPAIVFTLVKTIVKMIIGRKK